jgi:hypothetical protein
MVCKRFDALLPLFVDKCLTPQQMKKVQDHIRQCPSCAAAVDQFCKLIDHIQQLKPYCAPGDLCEKVMAAINAENQTSLQVEPSPRANKFWLAWAPMLLGGVGASALALTLLLPTQKPLLPGGTISTQASAVSSSRPVSQTLVVSKDIPDDILSQPSLLKPTGPMLRNTTNTLIHAVGYGMQNIPFEQTSVAALPLEWDGAACAVSEPQTHVVRSATDWLRLQTSTDLPPLLFQPDWSQQMLVAVFIGDQLGPRPRLKVGHVQETNSQILLTYRKSQDEPQDNGKAERMTRPYLLVLLPTSPLPVAVQQEP